MSSIATADQSAHQIDSDDYLYELATMQARHIDAAAGFETALERSKLDVVPVLRELKAMHEAFAAELTELLEAHGRAPDGDGAWMTYVQKTVVTVRDWLTGLDENIIPGLLNGERMLLDMHNDLCGMAPEGGGDVAALTRQRNRLNQAIDMLDARAA